MVDPTPWTAWGVLGLLGLVIVVLMGIVWRLFNKQTSTMEVRDKLMMDFVDRHRGETTKAMQDVATTVSNSYEKLSLHLGRNTRALQEMLLLNRFSEQIRQLKASGTPGSQLTEEEIARIFRVVVHEQNQSRRGDDA